MARATCTRAASDGPSARRSSTSSKAGRGLRGDRARQGERGLAVGEQPLERERAPRRPPSPPPRGPRPPWRARGGSGPTPAARRRASSGRTRVRARRAAARISASAWRISRSATGRKSARPSEREELQGAKHHPLRRVVEDERGDEPRAALLGQQVHRREHLVVVRAVEGAEEGLQGDEVHGRQVHRGAQRPLAQRGAEDVEVEALEVRDPRDPDERDRGRGPGEHDVAAREHALGQDEERRQRLPAPLPHDVDEGLRPGPDGVGEGQVEQLAARAVDRVAEAAVRALQEERRHEAAARAPPPPPPGTRGRAGSTARGAGRSPGRASPRPRAARRARGG